MTDPISPLADGTRQDFDQTLSLLGREQPRAGLERRMLAQLKHATPYHPSIIHRIVLARRTAPVLCVAVVALCAVGGLQYYDTHQHTGFVPAHPRAQAATHGVAAAAAVAVAQIPIHPTLQSRGRRRRAGRGQHGRVLLPPGIAAPTQRNLRLAPAH